MNRLLPHLVASWGNTTFAQFLTFSWEKCTATLRIFFGIFLIGEQKRKNYRSTSPSSLPASWGRRSVFDRGGGSGPPSGLCFHQGFALVRESFQKQRGEIDLVIIPKETQENWLKTSAFENTQKSLFTTAKIASVWRKKPGGSLSQTLSTIVLSIWWRVFSRCFFVLVGLLWSVRLLWNCINREFISCI